MRTNAPTIGFAESCEAAFALADALPGPWEVCWHGDSRDERRSVKIDGFRAGRLQGLFSVDALGRGFDVPAASCLLACRPLRSLATWLQELGRVMRPAPGKGPALVLDCAGQLGEGSAGWCSTSGRRDRRRCARSSRRLRHGSGGNGGISGGMADALLAGDADLATAADPPPELAGQERLLWYAASAPPTAT